MAMYSSRIIWDQHKEPALSAPLATLITPQEDTYILSQPLPDNISDYTIDDMIYIAKAAEIVDDFDGRPLAEKLEVLKTKKNVAILINAIDDEPYLSSKVTPLLALREEVLQGISLLQTITGAPAEDVRILVYRHMRNIDSHIPARMEDYKILKVSGGFPARPSIRQLRYFGNRSTLHIGVGAAIHLSRAVYERKKQISSFVTVHGNSVASPMNLEVSFDRNVTQVLERCGLTQPPTRVVVGGPMTGFAVVDTEKTRITPTTRGVLAFVRKKQEFRYSCIGCGRCERSCPSGLNPMYIYSFMDSGSRDKLAYFDPQYCIECGLCSYFCPSRLQVSVAVKEAKELVLAEKVTLPESEYSWADFKNTLQTIGKTMKKANDGTKRGFQRLGAAIGRGWKSIGEFFEKYQSAAKKAKYAMTSKEDDPEILTEDATKALDVNLNAPMDKETSAQKDQTIDETKTDDETIIEITIKAPLETPKEKEESDEV